MNKDISFLLDDWEYDPENNARMIVSDSGNRLLQIRLPLGIEQYHVDGRPDGETPFEFQTLLDYYRSMLVKKPEIKIGKEEFLELQEEGIMFYNRYISLFQLGEYELTKRDTQHNLDLCDLVEQYGSDVESKDLLLQYRPYILHINALSRYMLALGDSDYPGAETVLNQAIQAIESLKPVDTPLFGLEVKRSLLNLKKAKRSIVRESTGELSAFEVQLQNAVANEQYEEAAKLRDLINNLKDNPQ